MTGAARPLPGELPIRVIDQPGGAVLRCLCGIEAAQLRKSTVNRSMPGLRSSGTSRPLLGPDVSPAALLMMVAHARICERARAVLEAGRGC